MPLRKHGKVKLFSMQMCLVLCYMSLRLFVLCMTSHNMSGSCWVSLVFAELQKPAGLSGCHLVCLQLSITEWRGHCLCGCGGWRRESNRWLLCGILPVPVWALWVLRLPPKTCTLAPPQSIPWIRRAEENAQKLVPFLVPSSEVRTVVLPSSNSQDSRDMFQANRLRAHQWLKLILKWVACV